MALPATPGSVCYEAESSWGEDVQTFTTYAPRVRDAIDPSGLIHNAEAAGYVQQYRTGGQPQVKMVMGGSFKTKLDWRGHGVTTSGTPSLDPYETLLGIVFGTTALSLATSQTATGGTASVPTMSGATGVSAGGYIRFGALGDGDGDGQFYRCGTHSSSNLTLIGDLNGAPVNGAVVYPVAMTYSTVTASGASVTSTRWLLQCWGEQYECHGCYPMSVTISGINPGERPTIEITWGVSWWRLSTATFPNSVTTDTYTAGPVAAGSLNLQAVGTTTRNVRTTARSLSVTYNLNVMPLKGYGGVNSYQDTVGAVRGDDDITIEWTEDAEATTASPVVPGYWDTNGSYHMEFTGSVVAGTAIGFGCPRVCPEGQKPVMFNDGGIWRFRFKVRAYNGATTTSALTLSPFVLLNA